MIKLTHINKIYKVGDNDFYALKDINLEIQDGEFLSICGASGSGKTTLLNIIGCLDNPSDGEYLLDDTDISKIGSKKLALLRNKQFGFVLQDFALIGSQTVLYNVMLPLLYSNMPFFKIKPKALEALDNVGIKDQASKKVTQLSGGQKQRVAIARALVNNPSIILADEPTGQLDSANGKMIMELLTDINAQEKTVIVVTHDANVAAMTHRTVHLKDGLLVD